MATSRPECAISKQEEELLYIDCTITPVKARDLKPGDHIVARGHILMFKYYHHGIFVGHTEGVVDFSTTKVRIPESIRCVDIIEFTGGRPLSRVEYPTGTCLPPETTVALARGVKETPDLWGPYDIKTNNCEHFAMRCKTGKHASKQSVKAMRNKLKHSYIKVARAFSGLR